MERSSVVHVHTCFSTCMVLKKMSGATGGDIKFGLLVEMEAKKMKSISDSDSCIVFVLLFMRNYLFLDRPYSLLLYICCHVVSNERDEHKGRQKIKLRKSKPIKGVFKSMAQKGNFTGTSYSIWRGLLTVLWSFDDAFINFLLKLHNLVSLVSCRTTRQPQGRGALKHTPLTSSMIL